MGWFSRRIKFFSYLKSKVEDPIIKTMFADRSYCVFGFLHLDQVDICRFSGRDQNDSPAAQPENVGEIPRWDDLMKLSMRLGGLNRRFTKSSL
jgi:hypothetical protein